MESESGAPSAGGAESQATGWLPLLEYSVRTGVSLSTLRRYIKAGKIEFRLEDGRYLLPLTGGAVVETAAISHPVATFSSSAAVGSRKEPTASLQSEIARLEMELQKAREENAELRMLVALYEESLSRAQSPSGNA